MKFGGVGLEAVGFVDDPTVKDGDPCHGYERVWDVDENGIYGWDRFRRMARGFLFCATGGFSFFFFGEF